MDDIYKINISSVPPELAIQIEESKEIGKFETTRTAAPTLVVDGIYFHSKHEPEKESRRLIDSLSNQSGKRVYIFFGAGLGYIIKEALHDTDVLAIWMEPYPGILKKSLRTIDFSEYIKKDRLKILIPPFQENDLVHAFHGISTLHVSFIPHRPSVSWREQEYVSLKYICEKFFSKKDVNIATLSRFEKIWARNIVQNFHELSKMNPVNRLFDIAKDLPILVTGAGPSLYYDIEKIKAFRDRFVLIAVDTSLHVLTTFGINPDLIYSVDPQALNSSYMQGYSGDGKIVFDPTSTFHTLRLDEKFTEGFYTSSPFPLMALFNEHFESDPGMIPYGGSVSTNAVSLAELMGASRIYLVGQDLAFTDGFAHARGAILEERLNYLETRYFRREKHNYKQLTALPKIFTEAISGGKIHTNEKMQIFRRWFEGKAKEKNWINLTSRGSKIEGIVHSSFDQEFKVVNQDTISRVNEVRNKIKSFKKKDDNYSLDFVNELKRVNLKIDEFLEFVDRGIAIAKKIYTIVEKKSEKSPELGSLIDEMDYIDQRVSSKKDLNEIIGLSMQRTIFSITEGYDTSLSVREKENKSLGIARKSILLYEGLKEACELHRRMFKKAILRITSQSKS